LNLLVSCNGILGGFPDDAGGGFAESVCVHTAEMQARRETQKEISSSITFFQVIESSREAGAVRSGNREAIFTRANSVTTAAKTGTARQTTKKRDSVETTQ
jgi:hypothetical protein